MPVQSLPTPTVEATVAASARAAEKPEGLDKQTQETGRSQGVLGSFGVWLLYVPHYAVLKALGPRYGLVWARFASRLHWLLTYVGVHRNARNNFERLRKHFRTDASVGAMLRKHLEMKHERFARVRVYHQHGLESGGLRWTPSPSSTDALEAARRTSGGVLVVGFHFNFFEMTSSAFGQMQPERDHVQVKLLQTHKFDHTRSRIAELAMNRAIEADRKSGAPIFYLDDEKSVRPLVRKLRAGGAVAVAADGLWSSDYYDAPFFDGTLRVSIGWARLAAMTRSRVVIGIDRTSENRAVREIHLHDQLQCEDPSDEAIKGMIAWAVSLLEESIKEEPWGWHPWQRLHGKIDRDGVRRYELAQARVGEEELAIREPHASARSGADVPSEKTRVAILCNSVTPYRLHLHRRIASEVPEVELWTLSTHGNAYRRWSGAEAPAEIRPVEFGKGEPTNEQTMLRYSAREWRKGGDVIRWLRENRADAVFCQGCGDFGRLRVLRWCHKNGVPAFLTGDCNTHGYMIPRWKRLLKRFVFSRAVDWSTGLAPCGQRGLDLLRGYGGEGKPSYVFPFLPDTSLHSDPPPEAVDRVRERFDLYPDRRRIVFSARLMPVKRPDLAIKAFAEIADQRPEWDLVMLGDGELREPSEALVPMSLRRRVIWTGFFDNPEDVAAVYRLSDAMLLPSDHEPWGVVIVEAAAAGLAIVSSDVVGASPELVRPGRNGETFPAGDADALAETLLRVTSPERIDALKRESPRVLDEWLSYADPVDNFRGALRDLGLITDESNRQQEPLAECKVIENSSF